MGYISLDRRMLTFAVLGLIFFSIPSQEWPILCRVGRKPQLSSQWMSKTTLRTADKRGWRRRRDWRPRCWNAELTSLIISFARRVHCMLLCCFLTSKFIDIRVIVYYHSLHTRPLKSAPPSGPQPSVQGKRIVSTRRTIDVYETSHYRSNGHARDNFVHSCTPVL